MRDRGGDFIIRSSYPRQCLVFSNVHRQCLVFSNVHRFLRRNSLMVVAIMANRPSSPQRTDFSPAPKPPSPLLSSPHHHYSGAYGISEILSVAAAVGFDGKCDQHGAVELAELQNHFHEETSKSGKDEIAVAHAAILLFKFASERNRLHKHEEQVQAISALQSSSKLSLSLVTTRPCPYVAHIASSKHMPGDYMQVCVDDWVVLHLSRYPYFPSSWTDGRHSQRSW